MQVLPFGLKIRDFPHGRIPPRSDSRQEPVFVLGNRENTPFLFFHNDRDAAGLVEIKNQ